jgi:4-hydroxy-3-polyprenylbenzoate decarboxylase
VDRVTHRPDAIWLFTVVGRPPQEDTAFGALIHEITAPIIPTVLAGVRGVHAVDAAGVHPLLLAIGSERYTPYSKANRPQELLTQASAILGQGQLSLAKYLWIVNGGDDPNLDLHDVTEFFQHVLRRVDWTRDLHFHTCTTIDTLDYTGDSLNAGSKLVVAASGPVRRELPTSTDAIAPALERLPAGFRDPRVVMPGVLAITGPAFPGRPEPFNTTTARALRAASTGGERATAASGDQEAALGAFCRAFDASSELSRFPLVVIVDDSDFTARNVTNFVWVTFTRSNPATDIHGIASTTVAKHWGCRGALVIDARIKPHHAPPLVEAPEITRRVDALAARGGPLAKWL